MWESENAMHLGKSETVKDGNVIGIFDIEKATVSEETKSFLKAMQRDFKTVNLASDLPAAFVVTDEEYTDRVYMTALSVKTLKKRVSGYKEEEKNYGTKL